MTRRLEISLAPDGNVLLHLPLHTVTLPMSVTGLQLLRHILQARSDGATGLAERGNPTQWDLDQWLKSPEGQGALQLAGDRKRWKAIEDKTGVGLRKGKPTFSLSDLDIDGLL